MFWEKTLFLYCKILISWLSFFLEPVHLSLISRLGMGAHIFFKFISEFNDVMFSAVSDVSVDTRCLWWLRKSRDLLAQSFRDNYRDRVYLRICIEMSVHMLWVSCNFKKQGNYSKPEKEKISSKSLLRDRRAGPCVLQPDWWNTTDRPFVEVQRLGLA